MSIVIGEKPNYGMSIKGKRCCLKVTNTRKRYSVLIAISRRNKISFKIKKGSFNGETFKSFIVDDVLPKIKKANLFMDNARIHHYKRLKAYMKDNNIQNNI